MKHKKLPLIFWLGLTTWWTEVFVVTGAVNRFLPG